MTSLKRNGIERLGTGVPNLDAVLAGGLPKGSVVVVAGPPGGGKTILAQQICFHNASDGRNILYFNTLSEPVAKTLRYASQFAFFGADKLEGALQFVDLGGLLRSQGLDEAFSLMMDHVRAMKPAIVVIDSFRVFDDLAKSNDQLRKFAYELAVNLMAWETTTILLGEYGYDELHTNPLFSIVDSVLIVTQREEAGEQQRFIQVSKMRGAAHSRDEHAFVIDADGINVFAPRLNALRTDPGAGERCKTGIEKLDDLIGEGIPRGSSVLVAGVAGTGKTVLQLEFIYRGALAGERGLYFSFEETEERLCAAARGLGWDLEPEIKRGMVQIVFIPQPNIRIEEHILLMQERLAAMRAKRVAIDSISVFLNKVKDPQTIREKVFQLATIVQNVGAVGFFATDIPYGANQISRFGVEETVVDGIFLLSAKEEGLERQRYLEIYKLRGTAHLKGRHNMLIGQGGLTIFPRYADHVANAAPPPLDAKRRLTSGISGLDALLGGGLLQRSVTLISGSAGIGKSTLGMQFISEGFRRKEPGLYVALEEGPDQVLRTADELGLPLRAAVASGLVEIVFLAGEHRAHQLLTILSDKVKAQGTRRLVLDSISQIAADLPPEELRSLLAALTLQFKNSGVTSLLTVESPSLYSPEGIRQRGFSPVADNVIVLRYTQLPGQMMPTLVVVKTRSSVHDWGTYYFTIGEGGLRIEQRADALIAGPTASASSAATQAASKPRAPAALPAPRAKQRAAKRGRRS